MPQCDDPTVRAYSPWRDLTDNWPDVEVRIAELPGDLLGEVREGGRLIVLRRGTSSAQRRCTLTHEIVHLERGLPSALVPHLLAVEERQVHAEAARRLITVPALAEAIRVTGSDERDIAAELWVDLATLRARVRDLTRHDPTWRAGPATDMQPTISALEG